MKVQKVGSTYLAETRPIGGTYPRGKNAKEDKHKTARSVYSQVVIAELRPEVERADG